MNNAASNKYVYHADNAVMQEDKGI